MLRWASCWYSKASAVTVRRRRNCLAIHTHTHTHTDATAYASVDYHLPSVANSGICDRTELFAPSSLSPDFFSVLNTPYWKYTTFSIPCTYHAVKARRTPRNPHAGSKEEGGQKRPGKKTELYGVGKKYQAEGDDGEGKMENGEIVEREATEKGKSVETLEWKTGSMWTGNGKVSDRGQRKIGL